MEGTKEFFFIYTGVLVVNKGDAESVTIEILDMLEKSYIDKSIIIGLVFDTTSTNSGHISGIVVRLEKHFGRNLLQLACRHHIAELVCGAACRNIYGPTQSPNEEYSSIIYSLLIFFNMILMNKIYSRFIY